MKKTNYLAAALAVAIAAPGAATIISGTATLGGFEKTDPTAPSAGDPQDATNPPGDLYEVGQDNHQVSILFGFDEDQNIFTVSPIDVDLVPGGGAGQISGNGFVASHYIWFDPATTGGTTQIIGSVLFDSRIIGIATSEPLLSASDFLARDDVQYNSPGLRGLEAVDSVIIDPLNDRQILIDFRAGTPGDYIRVFTEFSPSAVPAPGVLGLLGLGLAGVGLARRRR